MRVHKWTRHSDCNSSKQKESDSLISTLTAAGRHSQEKACAGAQELIFGFSPIYKVVIQALLFLCGLDIGGVPDSCDLQL